MLLSLLTDKNVQAVAAGLGAVATTVHTLTPQHTKAHKVSSWLIKVLGAILGGGVFAS